MLTDETKMVLFFGVDRKTANIEKFLIPTVEYDFGSLML